MQLSRAHLGIRQAARHAARPARSVITPRPSVLPLQQRQQQGQQHHGRPRQSRALGALPDSAASLDPLRMALDKAQALVKDQAAVREALEAEAQEVAQLAVEAAAAQAAAKDRIFVLVGELDTYKGKVQTVSDQIKSLQAKELNASSGEEAAMLASERVVLQRELQEVERQLARVNSLMDDAYAKAVAADKAALKAEEVASGAMRAAEAAVKDEMQAVAVVKETQLAYEKAMEQVQAAVAPSSMSMMSMDGSEPPAAATAGAAAAAAAGSAAAAEPLDARKAPSVMQDLMMLGVAGAVAVMAFFFLHSTPPGQALVSKVVGLVAPLVSTVVEKVSHIHLHDAERAMAEASALLLTSIICVPLVVTKIPGGNPVLGYLIGGALVGPHALGIISDMHTIKHVAELGVIFLLFNIGLEMSLDRLQQMAKMVFGMGSLQVVLTLLGVAVVTMQLAGLNGPSAIILGGALAMSSTAVGIQVLEDRGEMGSRHGRAVFSVLLLQDLAVVVLLMLIPLLAPSPDGSSGGIAKIAQALGIAAVKAVVCIVSIIAGGRMVIQPLYKKISSIANAEIFAATTLLCVLGTSLLTQMAGLSLALGAFLAGLLISETEYALQVESDIAPYKGLLLGLFFMSVGMEISVQLFMARWKEVIAGILVLLLGKLAVVQALGPMFGLSKIASLRSGLVLAPGGEFAFVAFGEAVAKGVLPGPVTNLLYLIVALSMATLPYLAALGGKMGQLMEKGDMKTMQPDEEEMKELSGHVIIAGYGRSGQLLGQMLSENLIPFVALDVQSDRVALGRSKDMPVYFGDAGSPAVLHLVGAERAACAIIALDTPGANYRTVWAMNKHFPHVRTYVRAHDFSHAANLEKAGATAVVPEVLEPSLQLAGAVLRSLEYQDDEVARIVDDYRKKHMNELRAMTKESGTSLGFGFGDGHGGHSMAGAH